MQELWGGPPGPRGSTWTRSSVDQKTTAEGPSIQRQKHGVPFEEAAAVFGDPLGRIASDYTLLKKNGSPY